MDFILFILAVLLAVAALLFGWFGLSRKLPPEPVYEDETEDEGSSRSRYASSYHSAASRNRELRVAWLKEVQDARDSRRGSIVMMGGGLIIAAILLAFAATYTQGAGQGVIVTRFGGAIVKADATQGLGFKAPWDTAHKWDLFTRDISFSEPDPDYSTDFESGEITASRIATAVASGEESGAQVWFDLDATYNMATEKESTAVIEERLVTLFKSYRSQDRFTRQVVYPALLNNANTVPSDYTTVQFRGAGSVEAAQEIGDRVNVELKDVGITVATSAIKNVDFTEAVEKSIAQVEEKQQLEEAARAEAAAKQVQNEQLVKNAQAEADANEILSKSITPELVELRKIEAYKKGTVFVVPEGSNPIVNTNR